MHRLSKQSESGAVSLFIVIFSALLITIITVAFIRIMIQQQEQATTNDLSKSALDSSYAGVEDAKRAIIRYQTLDCAGAGAPTTDCVHLTDAFNSQECNTLQQTGLVSAKPEDKEVQVQQNPNDSQLEQAYTCVKVQLNTKDYLGDINSDASRLIHLKSTGAFNQVTVEWYSQQDLTSNVASASSGKVDLYSGLPPLPLPKLNEWPQNRPALLRLQLLQFGKTFNLSDFNKNDGLNRDDASLFLYPANYGDTTASFSDDTRMNSNSSTLRPVNCDPTFSTTGGKGAYACTMTISIPNPVGTSDNNNRDAYLRVDELYNTSTNFRVTLQNVNGGAVSTADFNAVQPAVDSTGRANDLFRRVKSRIDLEGSSIPSLEAAVDITGSLCKTFLVTDNASDYNPGTCQDQTSSP
ncbi:MAG: hypothetical protein JWO07_760 [Candidatus Saccharibacteria bacterium]|nr:hypothetical protein [Candidatus Saccharibacteria bacterium]